MKRGLVAVSAILVAGFGYWFWQAIEWKEKEVDRGFSDAAKQNPMLAAEQFLQSMDLATESRRGFSLLDQMNIDTSPVAGTDAVILVNAHRTLRRQRLDTLWQWVRSGGHLIVSTRNRFLGNSNPEQDLLLARLGVLLIDEVEFMQQLENNPDSDLDWVQPPAAEETVTDTAPPETDCSPRTVEVAFDTPPLKVDWYGRYSLIDSEDRATQQVNSRFGIKLLQFALEKGTITLTTDNQIWANDKIGCHDHAYLLQLFAGTKTWFVINQDSPSLWATIWRAAPHGMILAALALMLWLWQQAVRFGPILVRTHLDRRRFLEHTQANAAFLWRHGQQHTLIQSLRDDINQCLRLRHRGYEKLPAAQQVNTLHRITLLPEPLIEHAVVTGVGDNEQNFQQLVELLQRIRSHL